MKLLFCLKCHDLFKLQYFKRSCKCGKVIGWYKNNSEAIVNGKGLSLAIDNNDLAKIIINELPITNKHPISCWVRPHEGELNTNTKIERRNKCFGLRKKNRMLIEK